jgi:ankyrin repeat protein
MRIKRFENFVNESDSNQKRVDMIDLFLMSEEEKIEWLFTELYRENPNLETIKESFELGAIKSPNIKDLKLRLTPLTVALINGHTEIAVFLTQMGGIQNTSSELNFALSLSIYFNFSEDFVERLIEMGADPNYSDKIEYERLHPILYHGLLPLHMAVKFKIVSLVKLLISKGADPNAKDMSHYNATPLHYCAINESPESIEIAKFLLEDIGVYPNNKTNTLKTPLHWAAANQTYKMIKLLLDYGADTEAEDSQGFTYKDILNQVESDWIDNINNNL